MEGFRRALRLDRPLPEDGGGGLSEPLNAAATLPSGALGRIRGLFDRFDSLLVALCAFATIGAGLVLTYSIAVRYLLHSSTDWQDEMAVFLLVGATFISAPFVQSRRGHIAIEAIEGYFPKRLDHIRLFVADLVSLAFCGFFTWQSWLIFLEAFEDGRVTDSAWAPPLWIPYSFMTFGMTLLTARIILQLIEALASRKEAA
jgi:TRAP-type C4-dicarboxylate transport system permease small subunit